MSSSFPWPEFSAADTPLAALVKLSRFYGADPDFVLAGGGNTSVKDGGVLHVKGSGQALAAADANAFVALDRKQLAELLERDLGSDASVREERFKQAILAARLEPQKGQRPSVESVLHNLLPPKFVVHTHPWLINAVTCCVKGESLAKELFGDDVLWIPYVDPGFILAKTLHDALKQYAKRTKRDCPGAVLMQNHGLVICGETPEEIRSQTDSLAGKIQRRLAESGFVAGHAAGGQGDGAAAGASATQNARAQLETIAPLLRGLLGSGETLRVVSFDDSELASNLVCGADGIKFAQGGPLTPDQIVYCKSFPLWFELDASATQAQALERLRAAVAAHTAKSGAAPYVILVKNLGLFSGGASLADAQTVKAVYLDAVKVMNAAAKLGGVNFMTAAQRTFIENWEAESYRRKVSSQGATGRANGKIAIVTGAAQGFGWEIAQDLATQGATVILADINADGTRNAAAKLAERFGANRVAAFPVNVTDGASIAEMIHQTVRLCGGVDLFISNAGVLKAASVKTQPEKDFDFVTSVNYRGYFLCVQKVAPVLAAQHLAQPECWSDIIQINSKSGLVGSSRNGAYAGSKFGGIGLTQSFALELVEDGIKVNAICPGNFFDGPLWSDPQNGLFVQYLRTGKVPGAKTVEDVKRAYESKVPMGRGCRSGDVMKAVYYLMEQKYETGQALPVSGGQVMLA